MSIESLYQQARLSSLDFQNKTGINESEFENLLQYFLLEIPKKISNKARLFAILYVEKHHLTGKQIGQIIPYTNADRDGSKFILAANMALSSARQHIYNNLLQQNIAPKIEKLSVKSEANINHQQLSYFTSQQPEKSDPLLIDREFIKSRTDLIFNEVPLGPYHKDVRRAFGLSLMYYNIDQSISFDELSSLKWKTYIYLRKCILDYRQDKKEELEGILHFLESNNDNRSWLAQRLMDRATTEYGDLWGSGSHEWIERCLIVDVLKRSAGMVYGVEPEIGIGCISPDYDWLYFQAIIRSPTKYIFFKNHEKTIENGHPGAVKPNKYKAGFSSIGSPGFHKLLVDAFYASTTIEGFLKLTRNIFKQELYSGKKLIHASENSRYLIDGSKTTNLVELSLFRKKKLLPEGYAQFKDLLTSNIEYATHFGDNVQENISEVASDTSEEDMHDCVTHAATDINKDSENLNDIFYKLHF